MKNTKSIATITTVAAAILFSFAMIVTTTWSAASAQQPPIAVTPPTDTELVDSEKVIIEQIRNILSSSRLEDYRLYENGTAEYTIRQTTALGAPVNNTITVITEHRYTPANGYIFDNTTGDIITPQGEKLVLSTFD